MADFPDKLLWTLRAYLAWTDPQRAKTHEDALRELKVLIDDALGDIERNRRGPHGMRLIQNARR